MRLWPKKSPAAGSDPAPSVSHPEDADDDGYMNIDDLGNTAVPESFGEMMQAKALLADGMQRES